MTDGQTDGRTDGQTDWTIHRAAWSQLKTHYTWSGRYQYCVKVHRMRYNSQMNDPEFWILLHLFNDDTCHSRHISRPNDPEVMPGHWAMVSPTEYTEYQPMFMQPWHLQQLLTDCSCGDVTRQPVNRDGVLTAASQGRQATGLDTRASRVKWPAQFMSNWYGILFTE